MGDVIGDAFTKAGIILPMPQQWESIKDKTALDNLKDWGLKSDELEKKLFGTSRRDEEGKIKESTFLSEFDNGTPFMEFGEYLAAPVLGYYGAQIAENMYDTNIIGATAKRAGAERILNTSDRLLTTYLLMNLLQGNGGSTGTSEAETPEERIGKREDEIPRKYLEENAKYLALAMLPNTLDYLAHGYNQPNQYKPIVEKPEEQEYIKKRIKYIDTALKEMGYSEGYARHEEYIDYLVKNDLNKYKSLLNRVDELAKKGD